MPRPRKTPEAPRSGLTARAEPPPRLEARWFAQSRTPPAAALSPDGRTVALVLTLAGAPDLYFTRPDEHAWPYRMTFEGQNILNMAFSPDGRRLAYESDRDGDENAALYLLSTDGRERRALTDRPAARHHLSAWSDDGGTLYYSSNARNPAFFDCYAYDPAADRHRLLFESDDLNFFTDVWARGRSALLYRVQHNTRQTFGVWDARRRLLRDLTPSGEAPSVNQAPVHNRRDGFVYFLTDHGAEFLTPARLRPDGRGFAWLRPPAVDCQGLALSADGRVIAWTENRDGRRTVVARDLVTGRARRLPLGRDSSHGPRLSADGRRALVFVGAGDEPTALHVVSVGGRPFRRAVTFPRPLGLPRRWLVRPRVVSYRARGDGWRVSGFWYEPKTAGARAPFPTVCWFHGGPEWQEYDEYNAWVQFYCNRGYAVWACNFRGSTGFGKTFQRAVYRDWGGKNLDDCLDGLDHLARRGLADPARVAAVGASYGGYMTLRALTHVPDRWRCGVDVFGPSNLFTFIESVPPSWRAGTHALVGHPAADRTLLHERSPINFVDRLRAPLLVIQGGNDPRVVQAESDQMVASLRRRRHPVEYHVYPDEGHGFARTSNWLEVLEKTGAFLERHLSAAAGQSRRR